MTKLYEIANDYAALMAEGLDPEMIADTIEGMEGEIEDKIENILAIIKNKKALSEALKNESKNLADRAKAELSAVDRMKSYISVELEKMGKKSFKAGIHSLTVRKGVQSVVIDNADDLPTDYVEYVTTTKADKNRIKLELKAGNEVPGAHLETGKSSLIIK